MNNPALADILAQQVKLGASVSKARVRAPIVPQLPPIVKTIVDSIPDSMYDEDRVRRRSRVLGLAIEARKQRFPDEIPYEYQPFAGLSFEWNDAARESLRGYNKLDLGI